jgi:hypothetical protein
MTRQPARLAALLLVVCAVLSACGTTGGTSPFVVPLHPPKSQKITSEIRVASAAMEPEAADLRALNVQPWGTFGPNDLKNIRQSLHDTIAPHLPATSLATGSRLDLHVVIRRYAVRTSNTAGAVLACVAWAATNAQGELIYKEQFFASSAGYLVTTIGLIKDSVHIALIRRIATISLALATEPVVTPLPSVFKGTSTSLEEAVSRLPSTLVSMGDPSLAAFPVPVVSAVGLLTPSGVETVQWTTAKPSQDFDWPGYLGRLSTIQ